MTTSAPRVYSDLPIPPGEILEEELEARGMTQRELAARLGRPAQAVNEIIRTKKAITPETAIGLERVLGIDAHFWVNLETTYRLTLARNEDAEALARDSALLDAYPIGEMLKRGWIEAGKDPLSRLQALTSFLGKARPEPGALQNAIAYRITEAAQRSISLGALEAWLRMGELDAQGMETEDYDEGAFIDALTNIRTMTNAPPDEFVPTIQFFCAEAGVAFCPVPELPKSGANGATQWLTERKALLQMSLRGKWADIFWFTFFHEAGHIIKHRSQHGIILEGIDVGQGKAQIEAEADRFAADFLIPPGEWSRFCETGSFTEDAVTKFADSVGIAPFIVVGRLQKEKLITYNRLTTLKPRYQWVADRES